MHTEIERKPEIGGRERAPRRTRRYGLLGFVAALALLVLFAAGYVPRMHRRTAIAAEANALETMRPRVTVAQVRSSAEKAETVLPGNIQAIDETPIYARGEGYLKRRLVDIGDRVQAGHLLAEIETPELDQQIQQARAAIEQRNAALERARAAVVQSKANLQLSSITAKRWKTLVEQGVLSPQEGDQKQSDLEARTADVKAAEAAVGAAEADVRAATADLQRLMELKGFRRVAAPFAGVITERNVDTGTLISAGTGKPMFNLAKIDRLRIYVNVPQTFVPSIRRGQGADVLVQEFPGRAFRGTVTRTADSLDDKSHTLLTEVQVDNRDLVLLPGMYAQVKFSLPRPTAALLAPAEALVIRNDGMHVLAVNGNTIDDRRVIVGRDFGTEVEILAGLQRDATLVINPPDDLRGGVAVDVVGKR